jgi:hypothetical protein
MFLFVVVFYFSYSSFLDNGASPKGTNERFWDSRPQLLAAAENGKLDAVKFLVEECGIRQDEPKLE